MDDLSQNTGGLSKIENVKLNSWVNDFQNKAFNYSLKLSNQIVDDFFPINIFNIYEKHPQFDIAETQLSRHDLIDAKNYLNIPQIQTQIIDNYKEENYAHPNISISNSGYYTPDIENNFVSSL